MPAFLMMKLSVLTLS